MSPRPEGITSGRGQGDFSRLKTRLPAKGGKSPQQVSAKSAESDRKSFLLRSRTGAGQRPIFSIAPDSSIISPKLTVSTLLSRSRKSATNSVENTLHCSGLTG